MTEKIREVNNELFNWCNSLENKNDYTNPYLIIPEDNYWKAPIKVLILGKETYGWGEKEGYTKQEELENLYIDKINKREFEKGSEPFWDFYFKYIKPIEKEDANVGICVSNIALLGYPYGIKGYDTNLAKKLSEFLKKYLDILKTDIIVCFAGFGTEGYEEENYVKILNEIFGEYNLKKDTVYENENDKGYPLRELCFPNNPTKIKLYGTVHPLFIRINLHNEDYIKNTLINIIIKHKKELNL